MNKQVLLIDDDPLFHMIFTRLIQKVRADIHVTSHLNGKVALDHLKKSYTTNNHYIILLDINMPIINGWQFLTEIKEWGILKHKNMTLFVVSSSTDIDEINHVQSYDFVQDMLSKPLSIKSVKYILES